MDRGLVDTAAQAEAPDDRRIYGVAVARVVKNCDETHSGRVQVRLPWLPGYEPWARIAVLDQGAYFIPQVGDEVLVGFNHGDVEEVYVMGQLWNGRDRPPAQSPGDPDSKRILRTRKGHEIVFDDAAKSIMIKSATGHHVTLTERQIEMSMDKSTAAITLDTDGNITIKATKNITLDAQGISITGADGVAIRSGTAAKLGSGVVEIKGGTQCTIDAARIDIG